MSQKGVKVISLSLFLLKERKGILCPAPTGSQTRTPVWRQLRRNDLLQGYKSISDYGLIGDQRTCALVGIDGSIDWLCIPRFDSPSVFAAILDKNRGGSFRILPQHEKFESLQYYEDLTNILITEFKAESGQVRILDFMPCFSVRSISISSGEVHRRITCSRGEFELSLSKPRMNYGVIVPKIGRISGIGYSFSSPPEVDTRQELSLITSLKLEETEEGTLSMGLTSAGKR